LLPKKSLVGGGKLTYCTLRSTSMLIKRITITYIYIYIYIRVSKPIYTCKWTWVSEWLWIHLLIWVSEWVKNHLLIWVREWVRTHLLILVCVCEWELTSRFQCVCVSVSSPLDFNVWVSENSPPDLSVCVCVCEWERIHLLIFVCVCVSERELTSSFVFMSERENSPPFRPSV
jgi:hypothetical protein